MKAFEKFAVEQVKQVIESSKNNVADVDKILKQAEEALSSLKASSRSLVGWFKNPLSSQTAKLMAGAGFSH
jgi:ABC-type transporter Mla subunit MlaD